MKYFMHLIFTCFVSCLINGTPGDLDFTFGPNNNGISLTRVGRTNTLNQLVLQDGIGFYSVGEVEIKTMNSGIGRYTPNGILDTTFNGMGYQRFLIGKKTILSCLSTQENGNIIAGGYAYSDQSDFIVARFTPDGQLDSSFNETGYVTTRIGTGATINALKLQSDGKIVVGGGVILGIPEFVVARYNPDGTLDQSFGTDGITCTPINLQSTVQALDIQDDGKIITAGYALAGDSEQFALARYNTDGTLDNSFGKNGIVVTPIEAFSHAQAITLQSDGKIVVAGYTTTNYLKSFAIARYDNSGNLDSEFNQTGIVITELNYDSEINSLAIDTNENILAGGYDFGALQTTFAIARYAPNGILDTTFGTEGVILTTIGENAQINSLLMQPDGKIVAGGFSDNSIALVRYLAN